MEEYIDPWMSGHRDTSPTQEELRKAIELMSWCRQNDDLPKYTTLKTVREVRVPHEACPEEMAGLIARGLGKAMSDHWHAMVHLLITGIEYEMIYPVDNRKFYCFNGLRHGGGDQLFFRIWMRPHIYQPDLDNVLRYGIIISSDIWLQ
jgi:ribosomal protein L39E